MIAKEIRKNPFKDEKYSKKVNDLNHDHRKLFLVYFQSVLKVVLSLTCQVVLILATHLGKNLSAKETRILEIAKSNFFY